MDMETETAQVKVIAHIRSDFSTKFGIPRQSGLVDELTARIVFTPPFRNEAALRGLEGFSHIWLIWAFHQAQRADWSPTVRPPRLGGNTRMGVFATRSPFRPNSIGLSSVRLEKTELHPELGPVLHISGADLMNGTPIYDIKPYLPYADSHPEVRGGFTDKIEDYRLKVEFPETLIEKVPAEQREALVEVLANDPRPRYQNKPDKIYGLAYGSNDIHFTVREKKLTVCDVTELKESFDKQNSI